MCSITDIELGNQVEVKCDVVPELNAVLAGADGSILTASEVGNCKLGLFTGKPVGRSFLGISGWFWSRYSKEDEE